MMKRNLMMRHSHGMGRGLLIAALLVVGLAVAVPADAIVFDLTSDHCTGGCGTAPFGTVTLTQNGTTVDTIVHLFDGNLYVQTGAADFQAFKFNATGVVLGDITVDAHTPALVAATGAFNGDGTGNFGFGINCPTCANGGVGAFDNDIVFHVANATIADLTAPNNLGIIFVADILSGATGNTGPVDATVPNVPEPASLLLLGSGLVGLGAWRWKKSQV
jgi:PEP-CTERM motif